MSPRIVISTCSNWGVFFVGVVVRGVSFLSVSPLSVSFVVSLSGGLVSLLFLGGLSAFGVVVRFFCFLSVFASSEISEVVSSQILQEASSKIFEGLSTQIS